MGSEGDSKAGLATGGLELGSGLAYSIRESKSQAQIREDHQGGYSQNLTGPVAEHRINLSYSRALTGIDLNPISSQIPNIGLEILSTCTGPTLSHTVTTGVFTAQRITVAALLPHSLSVGRQASASV